VTEPVRVGLIVPSSNTVMEVDLYRRLPARFQVHTARMFLEETTPESEAVMLDGHVMPAVRDLATARPHVVVFGCTSGGALRGAAYDEQLCREISAVTGVETMSTIASVRQAIARRRGRRIGVITPYVDALNEKIRASIEADGVEVAGIHGLGIDQNFDIAEVPTDRIVRFAADSFLGDGVDVVFVSCTNFHAVDASGAIEAALGVPVVTSNHAVLEALMLRFVPPGEATRSEERDGPAS
jgi:maleate isomerase